MSVIVKFVKLELAAGISHPQMVVYPVSTSATESGVVAEVPVPKVLRNNCTNYYKYSL